MKYAIDRYVLGHEQEVSAELFLSYPEIPKKKSRFFCPECGETVFFRAKGTGEFYHQKQDGNTPECDKRVDGRSGLSLYERTGLPLYIVPDTGMRYCLGISFPPLGRQALDAAMQRKAEVRIAACGQKCQFKVNTALFFADQSTLLPVNFIPSAGRNYTIELQNANGIAGIRQKWADYADGFENDGGLFHYGAGSGRKIRRGDGISPEKQYYLVTECPYTPPYPEVQANRIGSIRLTNKELTVSRFSVNVSTKDATRYSIVNNYLRSKFGVWLLETSPQLTTLWPPTVLQQDAQIPIMSAAKKLYCSVSSGNDTPNVYSYPGNTAIQLDVVGGSVIVPFYESEVAVSVDRKYVGREVFFRRSLRSPRTFSYEFSLENNSGNLIDPEAFTQDSLSTVRSVKANAKVELVIGCEGHIYQHIAIRENCTPVPDLEHPEEVCWIIRENNECSILFYYHTKETVSAAYLDEACTLIALRKCQYGPLVPVPVWVAQLVRNCDRKGNVKLARFICSEVCGGKIRLGVLNALFSIKNL